MLIQVQNKSVYGVNKFYPVNSLGDKMAAFKGQKTLTSADIVDLKDMGFKVELVAMAPGALVGVKLGDL